MKRSPYLLLCAYLCLVGCQAPLPTEQSAPTDYNDFQLLEVTIAELQAQMESGSITSQEITMSYLERIAAIDEAGPELNSVIEVNPDALSIAKALDEERSQGKVCGPLHGIPVMIKDNIDTGDKMMTTAGALALNGNYAEQDAFLVTN